MSSKKADLYTRTTERIVAELEKGVRPWLQPWNAEHAAGRITRPLRHNGQPYRGINVVMLWMEAMSHNFACPIWMTYKQAQELGAQVRKGEKGSPVVFADRIQRTETNDSGEETEREIPFLLQLRTDRRPSGALHSASKAGSRSRQAHRKRRTLLLRHQS